YPQRIRFSIGAGEILTDINPFQAIGMDGPAFHNARKGIQELKKTRFLFKIVSDEMHNLDFLNNNLYLISHIINDWKKNRLEILKRLINGYTIQQISDSLKISTTAVYKNITEGALKIIIELFKEISLFVNQRLEFK
ncbi:hypothetical protein DRQ09_04675, partial [candidate division KSB1 bacterium]